MVLSKWRQESCVKFTMTLHDIFIENEKLRKEWHSELNGSLTPSDVSAGSRKKVWWRCEKGHEWQAFVYYRARQNRARQGGGACPACNPRRRKAAKPPKPIFSGDSEDKSSPN